MQRDKQHERWTVHTLVADSHITAYFIHLSTCSSRSHGLYNRCWKLLDVPLCWITRLLCYRI